MSTGVWVQRVHVHRCLGTAGAYPQVFGYSGCISTGVWVQRVHIHRCLGTAGAYPQVFG